MNEFTVGDIVELLKDGVVTEDTPIRIISEKGYAEIEGICGDKRGLFVSHDSFVLLSKYQELIEYSTERAEEEDICYTDMTYAEVEDEMLKFVKELAQVCGIQ